MTGLGTYVGGGSTFKNKDTNVASNVAAVINQGSPLMKKAETAAKQAVNTRGLLNSSMAVQAGQSAVMDYATPIGSQEASQNFTGLQNELQNDFAGEQAQADFSFRGDQAQLDRDLTTQTQAADIAFQSGEAAKTRDFQSSQATLDRAQQNTQLAAQLDSSEAQAVAAAVGNVDSLYQNTIANINANTDLNASDRQAQISAATALRNRQMAVVEQIHRVDLTW